MAAAQCSIYRDHEGQIEKVLAPNGNESILFKSLNELTKDKEEALRLWAQTYTPAFRSWFGDWKLLEEAKSFADDIKRDIYKIAFEKDTEKFLFEIAQQINSSKDEASSAYNIVGENLFDIAAKLFPDTKVGDEFKSIVSKIVDENGEPLVVYHGTIFNIDSFDKGSLGRYTGAQSAKKGFFFTNNKEVAKTYIKPERIENQKFNAEKNRKLIESYGKLNNEKIDSKISEYEDLKEKANPYGIKPGKHYYNDSSYIEYKDGKFYEDSFPFGTYERVYKEIPISRFEQLKAFSGSSRYGDYLGTSYYDTKYSIDYYDHYLDSLKDAKRLLESGKDLPNLPIPDFWKNDTGYNLFIYLTNKYGELSKLSFEEPEETIISSFLNIKDPKTFDYEGEKHRSVTYDKILNDGQKENKDGAELKNTYDAGMYKEDKYLSNVYVVFEPNQIKSVFNQGKFNKNDDNIYKQVIEPDDFNPIQKDQNVYEISQLQNANKDKEPIETSITNNDPAVSLNQQSIEIVRNLNNEDKEIYRKFLFDNLYTNKDNPTTTELINNAARLAKDLGRSDLVNMARLIYKYLSKNNSLSTRMIDEMDQDAKAYYRRKTNSITFARNTVGLNTMEFEVATVLHEMLHGLTFQPWYKPRVSVPLNADEQLFKNVVEKYYNYFKSLPGAARNIHSFSDPEEFLMGALFDKSFKNHLRLISEDESEESPFVRFMKDILRGFLKLFGINIDNKAVDQINPGKFEEDIFNALSDYLNKIDRISLFNGLKEEGRNYGLSFAVTAEGDYESERQKAKGRFTEALSNQVKKTIEKAVLSIKSFGSTIRSRFPESQEGFQTIFRQLNKLENPEYNLDQVDFFFDFTSEISAIMNMASTKIKRLYEDDSITDIDYKLKEYENIVSSIRNFDPIIKDIEAVKIKMELAGIKEPVKDINDTLLKRGEIESIYTMGVFPLVTSKLVDILSPGSKKAIDIANSNIDKLNQSLALATKYKATARIKQLEKQIKQEQDNITKQFTLNSDTVEAWLRGEMGDSNIYSTYMLAAISSSNPIVAGLQKSIRDNVGEIAPKLLDMQNTFQSQIEAYAKGSGRSINNIVKFNSPLIQIHKEIDYEKGKDEKGNYIYKDVISLLHAYNSNHITDLQNFKRKLTDLYDEKRKIENDPNLDEVKLADVIERINKQKEERRQFVKDFMEQRYSPEVHDALDMLYDDLGGFTIWDYMGPLIGSIEDVETAIDQEEDDARLGDLYNQLDDLNFELTRLSSLYEKSPDTNEFKVAQHLKKRRDLLSKYSTFQLTEKGARKFEAEKARTVRKYKAGEISAQRYERWFEDNTITELTKEYWEEKKRILEELNDVSSRMGLTNNNNEDLKKLYNDIEDIAKPYRDNNGIINGREISEKELSVVKRIDEEIEIIKENIASANGLTKRDKIELSNLHNQLSDIIEKLTYNFNGNDIQMLEDEKDVITDKISKINSKKKNVSQALQAEFIKLMKELGALDEKKETKYYHEEAAEQREKLKWAVDINQMPVKFFQAGVTYQKNGDQWLSIKSGVVSQVDASLVENTYRDAQADIAFGSSKWWKDNHITVYKFKPDDSYNPQQPGSYSGEWIEEEQPLYVWLQTRPRDSRYINEGQPSIKYKKRIIKDEYVNKNYRESISGDVQPKLNGAKDDRFVNKEYQRLVKSNSTDDKATLAYLNFLTNTYLKAQESIPSPKRKGYELPSIRKSDIERFFSGSVAKNTQESFSRLGNMLRLWNDDVATNEQDKDVLFGYNDDFYGIVPMKFLGQIDAKDQSVDLAKSILVFAEESLKREQLIKSLPFANAIRDVVNNPDYRPVKTKEGIIQTVKRKFLPKGTELAKRSESNHTALQVNELIKTEIYGENMKDVPGAKLVNTTLGIGAKLMLGLNFVSSIQNYANAFTQSMIETESKISGNFTLKNYYQAQKIYYGHIHELMSDMGKYGNKSYINQFFDYFGGINFKLYTKNNKSLAAGKLREFLNDLSLPNTVTEHMLNYHMGIAIALNYRVKANIDGKETYIPIFEAFTLNNRKFIAKPGVQITEEDRKEMISRLNSSSRRINGEYGDKILADKFVLGKLVLFMNRYVIPFVVKRYGSRKFNIQDGVREEGYWRLFGKLLIKDIKSKSIPILMGWKYYTKEEKTAIIRSTTEFGFSVMFFLMLKGLGGDDNKKLKNNSLLVNNMIYALKGIQQQNEAFMPIPGVGFDDLFRKIQNPFPILGKVKNLVNIINHGSQSLYYEMGLPGVEKTDVIYSKKTGWHEPGDFKVMADLEKLIALPQRIMQYMYPDEAIKNMDAMSRIK